MLRAGFGYVVLCGVLPGLLAEEAGVCRGESCPAGGEDPLPPRAYAMSQKAYRAEAQSEVDEAAATEVSVAESQTREHARARLLVEQDLSRLDASHFRAYRGDESCAENANKSFSEFLSSSRFGDELTLEELAAFRDRFIDELRYDCENDPDVKKHWTEDVRKAIHHEKPVMTKALADSINSAGLSYTVAMKEWMLSLSNKSFSERVGKMVTPEINRTKAMATEEYYSKHGDSVSEGSPPPEHFDSRAIWPECAEVIGRIHDQGTCGSCWAFGALTSVDSRLCIATHGAFSGAAAQLSRAYVVSCAIDHGCWGGLASYAYDLLKAGGVPTGGPLGCKPYRSPFGDTPDHYTAGPFTPPCASECEPGYGRDIHDDKISLPGVGGYREIWPTNALGNWDAKKSMMQHGPLSFGIYANAPFLGYSSGIFSSGCGWWPNHEVVAIGWGPGYFLGQNSWGEHWGEGGTFRAADCVVTDWTLPGDIREDVSSLPMPSPGGELPMEADEPPVSVAYAVTGGCIVDSEGCVTSPNYPGEYGNNEHCAIGKEIGKIAVRAFSTEIGWDTLTVNGQDYHGSSGPHGVLPTTDIFWQTDDTVTASGWRICPS